MEVENLLLAEVEAEEVGEGVEDGADLLEIEVYA